MMSSPFHPTGAPVIVNCALTGMVPTKGDNAAVPVTPDEIADDCERCAEAGAAIVHLHARDEDGRATYRLDVYEEIVRKVRERAPDVIVCVSTSGRVFREFDQRAAALDLDGDLKPEMASLTLGSLNFPREASVNDPRMIQHLAERMAERDILPELEVFDLGMIDYAKYLIKREILKPPFYFNLLLGSLGKRSELERGHAVGRLEAEDLRVERELRLQGAARVLRVEDPVALVRERHERARNPARPQRARDRLGVRGRDDRVA